MSEAELAIQPKISILGPFYDFGVCVWGGEVGLNIMIFGLKIQDWRLVFWELEAQDRPRISGFKHGSSGPRHGSSGFRHGSS